MRKVASLPVAGKYSAGALWNLAILGCAVLLSGCAANRPAQPRAYFGPTETLAKIAAQISANNQQLTSVWARIEYFEARVRAQRGAKPQFVNGTGGYLLVRKPNEIRIRASKLGVGPVIDAGANDQNVWLIAAPADRGWWAERKNLGRSCMEQMPIDPLAIMDVLGIGVFDSDFMRVPVPVMRFNNDRDAYMMIWESPAKTSPARWIARREIWYDRVTKLPELVNLFDEKGRIVVSAYLSEHQIVEGTTAKMARKFQLLFPETDSHFTFFLSDVKLHNGDFPNTRSFFFNPVHSGVRDLERMDENCK